MTIDIEKLAEKARAGLPPKAESAKKPEAKDAGSASSAEIKKTKEEEQKKVDEAKAELESKAKVESKVKEAESQAKKDEEILSKKEEELDDAGKKRKVELLKVKSDAEDKKSNVQKRFDELTMKIKTLEQSQATTRAEKEAEKAEKEALKTELDAIKKQLSMTPEDKVKGKIKSEMLSRQKKYAEEDKEFPKEERREMSKEQLDEWLLEDYEGATDWITRRSIRRVGEESYLRHQELANTKASEIKDKQQKSAERSFVKHPELDVETRMKELKDQGKSKDEIKATIIKENPKYKLAMEILEENPDKYILSENGPELIVEEIEKRLSKKEPEGESEVEKLRKELAAKDAEIETLKNLDAGISSSRHAEPKGQETELDQGQVKLAKKVGLDPERLKKRIKERKAKGYDD